MNTNDTTTNTQQPNTPTPEETGGTGRLFTQEQVNAIVQDRLAREREKLADDGTYRALYEKAVKELEGMKAAQLRKEKEAVFRTLAKAALDPEETGHVRDSRLNTVVKAALIDGVIDGMELDDDGNAKDADQLKKAIADEWPEYIITVETRGADIAHPPVYAMRPTVDAQIAEAFKPKI